MNKEEIKEYLKNNMIILCEESSSSMPGDSTKYFNVVLQLEGEEISRDWFSL